VTTNTAFMAVCDGAPFAARALTVCRTDEKLAHCKGRMNVPPMSASAAIHADTRAAHTRGDGRLAESLVMVVLTAAEALRIHALNLDRNWHDARVTRRPAARI